MTLPEIMGALQERLVIEDVFMAGLLESDASTVSKFRAETLELPIHSKFLLLELVGFVNVKDMSFLLLPNRAKEKVKKAITSRILDCHQKLLISELSRELKEKMAYRDWLEVKVKTARDGLSDGSNEPISDAEWAAERAQWESDRRDA